MNLPVAILAGGRATRLYPITETIPKVLVDVAGKPFAAHQVELLKANGLDNLVFCVGHLGDEVEAALGQVDAIICPSSPHVAFKLGVQSDDPLKMYLEDVYMGTASLAGLPSLALPAGFAKPDDGDVDLPVGLQIIGRRFDESTVLSIGNCFEQATEWHKRRPGI